MDKNLYLIPPTFVEIYIVSESVHLNDYEKPLKKLDYLCKNLILDNPIFTPYACLFPNYIGDPVIGFMMNSEKIMRENVNYDSSSFENLAIDLNPNSIMTAPVPKKGGRILHSRIKKIMP